MNFRTKDGRKLTYRRMGSGPILVCHPGGPGFSALEFGDLAGLWERFTLVMLNPRGTGGSDRPSDPRAYQIDDYVADLDELRQHLGLERISLLGFSHGGIAAQAYAAAYPNRLIRLVLASTLPRFGPEQEAAMKAGMDKRSGQPWFADAAAALEEEQDGEFRTDEQLGELVFREMPLYFARFGPAEAGYLDAIRSDSINADALRVFNEEIFNTFDLRSKLPSITAPTLVINGDEDFICGPVCAAEMSAAIRGSRQVIIGDSGHMTFVEQPEAFHTEVGDFLEGA
ncbi:MAG TPA: alpha/beta hydrolase [Candidatus Dormibacteraeota bacterium]|jgi:pimeloyl-ACP methyl ester carboxylesterase|nr:alpha/beta hydrolase [Candidatus Dormibacteraeota bacterium]